MDADELVARAHVVALPLRERFRGIDVREALLLDLGDRWLEWSPFPEYDDPEASGWLGPFDSPSARSGNQPPGSLSERSESKGVRVNATIPAVPAEEVANVLARFPGCRTAKVKVAQAGQSLADDLARVAAVREHLGPLGRIRVDANAAWSLDDAVPALLALARYDLQYAEQPVASVDDLARLRERVHPLVPIAADESIRKPGDPLAVARAGAADVIVLKMQPLGGPARALEIAERARDASRVPVRFVTSSALETSVGLAAAARFAATIDAWQPGADLDHGLGTAALLAADVTSAPLLPLDGRIPLREVAPDPELLARHAAAPDRRDWWLARLRRCASIRFQGIRGV
ncbi:MAG: o-succinylbenzoate synthase [Microbacteriaceae bacterium]|nr:o-succinylbenzoate synthase [Microbacteriaceae bacterium]